MTSRALVLAAIATTLAIACGGSTTLSGSGGDAGGPSADAAGADTGAVDAATSGSEGGGGDSPEVSVFCAALAGFDAQCGPGTRCAQAEVEYCSTWAPSFSSVFLTSETSCVAPPYTCRDGGTNPIALSCVASHFASVPPTAAQQKVKDDFCAMCPDGAAPSAPTGCTDFLTLMDNDAGTLTAVGAVVRLLNDSLDTAIDQQCTGPAAASDAGAGDCVQAFESCAAQVLLFDANLPAACTSGLRAHRALRVAAGDFVGAWLRSMADVEQPIGR
jgi:hypothetical protein